MGAATALSRASSTSASEQHASQQATVADSELLRRYLAGDQTAFTDIVQRHTNLVSRVCYRMLSNQSSDADDAFQATFLILAKKARGLQWHDSIAGWLYETARRTAANLRTKAARRRGLEKKLGQHTLQPPGQLHDPAGPVALSELVEVLDTELARLPQRLREVVLLSQAEGLSRQEVADRLGISLAAVKDRLERGRQQLRSRLLARGVTLGAATLAAWLAPTSAQAAGATALIAPTAQAATAFAAGQCAANSFSAVALANEVLALIGFGKLKSAILLMMTLLTAGSLVYGMLQDAPNRFSQGLRGTIVAVEQSNASQGKGTKVTVSLDEYDVKLSLDVAAQAEVWHAYQPGTLDDLRSGQYVSLRLADDHRTVDEIHIQGSTREASLHAIDPTGKKITVAYEADDENVQLQEIELAENAVLRIGGLPAAADEFVPGMELPLEFNRNGTVVNAIEAEAAPNTFIEGEVLRSDAERGQLFLGLEDDDGVPAQQAFEVTGKTLITYDGQPAQLTDIVPGAFVRLRLSLDRSTVRAIQATSPEVEADDAPAAEGAEAAEGEGEGDDTGPAEPLELAEPDQLESSFEAEESEPIDTEAPEPAEFERPEFEQPELKREVEPRWTEIEDL